MRGIVRLRTRQKNVADAPDDAVVFCGRGLTNTGLSAAASDIRHAHTHQLILLYNV